MAQPAECLEQHSTDAKGLEVPHEGVTPMLLVLQVGEWIQRTGANLG